MTITNRNCCVLSRMYPKQSFLVVCLFFALMTISCFIPNVDAQTPSGNAKILGPDAVIVGREIEISIELINPNQVNAYNVDIQYPKVVNYQSVSGANGNSAPNVSTEVIDETTKDRHFTSTLPAGEYFSPGLLFTAKFVTDVVGHHDFEIVEWQVQTGGVAGVVAEDDGKVTVRVIPVASGSLAFHRRGAKPRFNVPTVFQLRLTHRTSAHHYSITIDPSENLGALTVWYDSDDTNITAIPNHTAGAPITVGADLADMDSDGLYDADSTVVTLAFTPTETSDNDMEGTLEITSAKIYGSDTDTTGSDATLPSNNPLTFTIAEAKGNVRLLNTGTGPTPTIKFYVGSGTRRGPFDVDIDFKSENYVSYQINADAGIDVQRGITGFEPEDIEISGTAEAFLTGKLWGIHSTTGGIVRINPTKTGTVEIYVPANVVTEIGTGLPNVASERFIVNVELDYPPWDVNEDGSVDQTDVDLVEAAIGQGLHQNIGRGGVWADNSIENARTDVNGDMYVTAADVKMVADNRDDNGAQGSSEQKVQEERRFQPRSTLTPPPDASVWMPDANIRRGVRRKLDIADDKDLTQVQMTELTSLEFRNAEITDITGLEYATNLTTLVFRNTQVSDLEPLSGLTKLRSVKLVNNNVSNITPLGNLINLTFLNISDNNIRDITALGNLTNLTELWARDNDVTDISTLASLTKLRKLRLQNNPILDTSPIYPLTRNTLRSVDISIAEHPPWDVNEDGNVDATDSALVTAALGQSGNAIVNPRTDVNGDNTVDNTDLTLVTDNLDTDGAAPSSVALSGLLDREILETLDRETLAAYISTLRTESDGSLKYLRAIDLLEHLLAATRPQETLLLANYPNPFNPETWIPYHLANASDVKITIYNILGQVIRRLDLGHQPPGRYTIQSRAAYWDGINDFGEHVASGIYFYELRADNISSLRKMLILK